MKIRQGFVSNSSTSSYIVAGIYFESIKQAKEQMLPEKLAQLNKKAEEHNSKPDCKWQVEVDDWIRDMGYGGDSFVFGDYIGSIDYVEELASPEEMLKSIESAKKSVTEWFGEEKADDVKIWGLSVEC